MRSKVSLLVLLILGLQPQEVAEKVRVLYGKLSNLTRTYLDTLRKLSTFEALLQLFDSLPASVTDIEIEMAENILRALSGFPDRKAP